MWVRKHIDIGWFDLGYGLIRCVRAGDAAHHERRIARHLPRAGEGLACLSVRSGFDLLLAALALPPGSEVWMTALTLPHMAEIVRAHGLVPVPVDLDPVSMAPDCDDLERAMGEHARVLVVAHLFGGCCRMERISELCRNKGVILVEDRAQAFGVGKRWGKGCGDVDMFSFGTIKTNTAGGGAVLRIRDADLLEKMKERQAAYPLQERAGFAFKLLRIGMFRILSYRRIHSCFRMICRLAKVDADRMLGESSRAFPKGALLECIRRRPHAAQLALLERVIRRYDPRKIRRRALIGREMRDLLADRVGIPGAGALCPTYWVFPVTVEDPEGMARRLADQGFDATTYQSMDVVEPPPHHPSSPAVRLKRMRGEMVYLPVYDRMRHRDLERMAGILRAGRP